jgi:hypothetical protein
MTTRLKAIRFGLLALAIGQIGSGAWALLAPRSFYDDFPGGGRSWVSPLGPYNEHMTVDYGALSLGIVILLVGAAWILERRLVLIAIAGYMGWSVPHFLWHMANLGPYDTTDAVANVITLGLTVAVPLALIPAALGLPRWQATST